MHVCMIRYPQWPCPELPEKVLFGNSDATLLARRRTLLECFVRSLVTHPVYRDEVLVLAFLGFLPADTPRSLVTRAPYVAHESERNHDTTRPTCVDACVG
jgi:hypothetical protein